MSLLSPSESLVDSPSVLARLLMANGAGFGNVGDDVIAYTIVRGLVERVGVQHVKFIGSGPRAKVALESLPVKATSPHHPGTPWGRVVGASRFVGADALIIGGGGLLNESLPAFYRPYTRAARLAERLKVPTAVIGVGVEEPRTAPYREGLRRLVDQAVYFSVRDQGSADVIADVTGRTVTVMPDPAFALPIPPTPTPERPTLLVSLRPWWHLTARHGAVTPERQRRLVSEIGMTILDVDEAVPDLVVHFVSMSTAGIDDDSPVTTELMGMPVERLRTALLRVEAIPSVFSNASAVLGMRLHSLILGAAAGRPVIGLEYDRKIGRTLDWLGAPSFDVDTVTANELVPAVVETLRNPPDYTPIIDDLRGQVEHELDVLAAALS